MNPLAAPRQTALLLATSLIAALAFFLSGTERPVQAAGAALAFPSASCSGSSTTVSFAWTPPAGATETWIDLSPTDNNFAAGTYQNVGPLAGGATNYTWSGLKVATPYFWRVDSKLASGWVASETGIFVACSEPILLAGDPDCLSATDTAVNFRWAPATPPARQQWIDVSTQGSFAPGTYVGYGAFGGGQSKYRIEHMAPGGYAYRLNTQLENGTWRTSIVRTFVANCGGTIDIDIHGTGDTFVYKRLGISAPVNVRKVGADGAMLNPAGKDDVVRYDFGAFRGLGGYPSQGGTTVLAGHLDYRPYYQAVFFNLTKARPGDVIEYYKQDGGVVLYTVNWVGAIPFDQSLTEYLYSTTPETMILITCDGSFDQSAGGYDKRVLVYAVAGGG